MLPKIRASRVLACLLGAGALTVGLAVPAFAHVTVNPREAEQGGYAKLTFRVPNESDTASTVKVQVSLPTDTPFPSARTKPHPGWTIEAKESKLPKPVKVGDYNLSEAVTSITWTAQPGNEIKPGEFEEFDISVGPLPEKASIAFPAVQTYSDKSVVKWNEPVKEGAEEPEHPAPTLTLVKAEGDDHHGDTNEAAATQSAAPVATSENTGTQAAAVDTTARTLGAAGLGVGVLCLIVLLVVAVSVRRNGSTTTGADS